ncbi:MAG: transposase [Rhodopila sp.]
MNSCTESSEVVPRWFFRSRGHDNAPVAKRYLHGLAQAEAATLAAMAAVVEDDCTQQFQPFISNAPWRHEPVIAQIGCDTDRLLGGKPNSALILDESSFVKQDDRSVGVARPWCGRLGKVDNCQVAVFAVLTDGARHTPVDMRLYLPQRWIDDPARSDLAEIPPEARTMRANSALALEMVRAARARGMRFGWVGVDGGYGKEPAFLRALDEMGETFVADVHGTQRVWSEPPGLHVPAQKAKGRPPSKQQTSVDCQVAHLVGPVAIGQVARHDRTQRTAEWTRLMDCRNQRAAAPS